MAQFSLILNKPVLEKDSSCIVGRIKNAYFSQECKCIAYFVMLSCDTSQDVLIPFDDVLSFKDAIVVQNSVNFRSSRDVDFTAFRAGIMDMPVYTQTGVLKGNVSEVEFYQSGKVSKICTENEQYSPSAILSVGNAVILKGATKTQKPKQNKIPRPTVETLATINETDDVSSSQSTEYAGYVLQNQTLGAAPPAIFVSGDSPLFSKGAFDAIVGDDSVYDDTHTPTRIICDYEFLLGRVLSKDLTTYSNKLIARKGEVVSDDIVNKARLNGKLVELTLNSSKTSE